MPLTLFVNSETKIIYIGLDVTKSKVRQDSTPSLRMSHGIACVGGTVRGISAECSTRKLVKEELN